jgi:hypothetical protein
MPLLDIVEVSVHLEDLVNLDLLRKGLYRVRCTASLGGATAIPFSCSAHPSRLTSVSRGIDCAESELGSEAGSIEEACYVTRSVSMRYSDERFDLGETVLFRLETPSHSPSHSPSPLELAARDDVSLQWQITLDLQRADSVIEEAVVRRAGLVRRAVRRTSPFTTVSTRALLLPHPAAVGSLRMHVPLLWDPNNLAGMGVTVQTCLVTSRFERPPPPPLPAVPGILGITVRGSGGGAAPPAPEQQGSSASSAPSADAPVGLALLRWASGFRTSAEGPSKAPAPAPPSRLGFRSLAGRIAAAAGETLAVVLNAAGDVDARRGGPGWDGKGDDHHGGLPAPARDFLAALAEHDAAPQSLAEALFPAHHHVRAMARATRRARLVSALRELQEDEDAERAAAAAAAAAGSSLPSLPRPRTGDGPGPAAVVKGVLASVAQVGSVDEWEAERHRRETDAVVAAGEDGDGEGGGVVQLLLLTRSEVQDAHARLLGPVIRSFVRLQCILRDTEGRPADGGPAPLSARSYCPSRFPHPVVAASKAALAAGGGTDGLLSDADISPQELRDEFTAELLARLPRYTADGAAEEEGAAAAAAAAHDDDDNGGAPSLPESTDAAGVPDGFAVPCLASSSFASRALLAFADPDAVVRALANEAQVVAGEVYTLWGRLQRETARRRAAVEAALQTRYRVAALRQAAAARRRTVVEEAALLDPRALAPSASAHASLLPPLPPPLPAHLAFLLDPAVAALPATLTLSEQGTAAAFWAAVDDVSSSSSTDRKPLLPHQAVTLPSTREREDPAHVIKRPHMQMVGLAVAAEDAAGAEAAGAGGEHSAPPTPPPDAGDPSTPRRDMFAPKPLRALPEVVEAAAAAVADEGDGVAAAPLPEGGEEFASSSSPQSEGGSRSPTPALGPPGAQGKTFVESQAHGARDEDEGVTAAASSDRGVIRRHEVALTAAAPASRALIPSSARARRPGTHVVVFLNGLGGSVHDSRVLRAYLKMHHPHLLCVAAASNQGKETEGCLVEAGARVAREVHDLLTSRLAEDGLALGKFSLVSFSLGGVVARIALRHPLLLPFLPHAHALVTVASPHLGVHFSSSVLSAGLFLLRQFRSSVAMAQLSLLDDDGGSEGGGGGGGGGGGSGGGGGGVRGTLLHHLAVGWEPATAGPGAGYRRSSYVGTGPGDAAAAAAAAAAGTGLSAASGPTTAPPPSSSTALAALRKHGLLSVPNGRLLAHFRHVLLFASQQDSYAPFSSCLAQSSDAALDDAKVGPAYLEMVRGFHAGLPAGAVRKTDVRFHSLRGASKLTVDGVIGREAHIAFLECEQVAAALALSYADVWDGGEGE